MTDGLDIKLRKDIDYIFSKVPIIYKYLDCDGSKAMLSKSNLLFKNPYSSFNDPYDCYVGMIKFDNVPKTFRQYIISQNALSLNPLSSEILEERLNQITDNTITNLYKTSLWQKELLSAGITCFSERYDNLLMWSHYSKSHKGVCIGLDTLQLYAYIKDIGIVPGILKVKYVDKFEKLDYFVNYKNALLNCFRTKSEQWEYEKEIRIFLFNLVFDLNNQYLLPIRKEIIQYIYLGSKIIPQDEKNILSICRNSYPNVNVYKMKLHSDSFTLVPDKINHHQE